MGGFDLSFIIATQASQRRGHFFKIFGGLRPLDP